MPTVGLFVWQKFTVALDTYVILSLHLQLSLTENKQVTVMAKHTSSLAIAERPRCTVG